MKDEAIVAWMKRSGIQGSWGTATRIALCFIRATTLLQPITHLPPHAVPSPQSPGLSSSLPSHKQLIQLVHGELDPGRAAVVALAAALGALHVAQ